MLIAGTGRRSVHKRLGNAGNVFSLKPSFSLPLLDLGGGAVNLNPLFSVGNGTPTFTRATTAYTVNSAGTLVQVSSGVARSYYDPTTLAYLGYLAEGLRTNLALQSQTLGTTWAVSNALDMNAVVADQYVAPDGTTTMDQLSTKATNAPHYLKQAITFAASVHTFSAYLKYVATQRWAALALNDGTTTWAASFDLLNGAVGALAANTTSTITATATAGVYRVTMTTTATAAAAGNIYISMNSSDSASLQSWNAAGTELLGAWGAQLEAAAFASSYIPTTTTALARNADVLTYPSAGNIGLTQGTAYAELSTSWSGANPNNSMAIGFGTGFNSALANFTGAPTIINSNDASSTITLSGLTDMSTGVRKRASSWSGSTRYLAGDGTVSSPLAFDGSFTGTVIYVGDTWFGTIRNVRIDPKALTAAQLQAMTT